MKRCALALCTMAALAGCSDPPPEARVYRYGPQEAPATTYREGMQFSGSAVRIDPRNHGLEPEKEDQHWLLVPGAFLLTSADGHILRAVAARYP